MWRHADQLNMREHTQPDLMHELDMSVDDFEEKVLRMMISMNRCGLQIVTNFAVSKQVGDSGTEDKRAMIYYMTVT